MTELTFTWSTARLGNEGFVHEERSDGTSCTFGPMPPHVVPAFLNARRSYVAWKMDLIAAKRIVEPPLTDEDLKLFQ